MMCTLFLPLAVNFCAVNIEQGIQLSSDALIYYTLHPIQ